MRIKLVGIFTCMIVILGIFIVYTNQSIGKEQKKQTMKPMKTP